ncbi:MAG: glycosyltransferase [Planctomycetes bacterium]|nr:glycosyltransferase [Planctomycetota bacterium]
MSVAEAIWATYACIACLYWAWLTIGVFLVRARVARLDSLVPPEPNAWPRLSVLVPARNEADTIESAATTLSQQDYPSLEILLINDRSEDETGSIMDRVAAANPRIRAIHVTDLPEGWLGKVHALDRGCAEADGQWLLLTDADVHFEPGALRRVIAWSMHRRLDHLAAAPDIWSSGFFLDAAVSAFLRSFCVGMRLWAVEDPHSGAYIGVGAFNLLRREAFERTAGFEWLRLEVADDVGVGLLMKQSGTRCGAVNAVGQIGLHWYPSLAKMLVGAEKAFASLGGCSVWRMCVFGCVGTLLDLSPWLTLLAAIWFHSAVLTTLSGLMILGHVVSAVAINRWAGRKLLPGLLAPVMIPFALVALLRTTWLGWRRGGVAWRNTIYPSHLLRAGKRVWIGRRAKPSQAG